MIKARMAGSGMRIPRRLRILMLSAVPVACLYILTPIQGETQRAQLNEAVIKLNEIKSEKVVERINLTEYLANRERELFGILTKTKQGKYRGYIVWWNESTKALGFGRVSLAFLCDIFKVNWACELRARN